MERVIQLSHYHSGTQTSNAEWVSTIPNAITLNKGDSIAIHSIFLDVALSNNQNITIEKDVNITFKFTPYICMGEARLPVDTRYCDYNPSAEGFPVNTPYYTVYNPDDDPDHFEVFEETFRFKVLAGLYTPQSLAQSMTDSMTRASFTVYDNTASPPDISGFPQSSNTFARFINQYYGTTVGNQFQAAHQPYYIWTKIGQPVNTWLVAGIPFGINNYVPDIDGAQKCSMTIVGASEVGIEYNNSRFSFFNMLPYFLPADKPSVWSAKYGLNSGGQFPSQPSDWSVTSTYGGVLFTAYDDDFDPTGNTNFFKSVLGIDPSKFCMDIDVIAAGGYGNTFQNYITTPKVSLDLSYIEKIQYYYKTSPVSGVPTDLNFPLPKDLALNGNFQMVQSNITEIDYPPAFVGSLTADVSKGGHYLVQVKNMTSTQMVGDQLGETGITAILSKQYNFSTTITGYPESGVPYIHNSDMPINIQNFHISIINPNSRRPISNDNIGDKSYIYLSVITQNQNEPENTKK